MQYAVIKSGGKQYKVNVGDTIELDKISEDTKNIIFDEVLLISWDGKVTLGKPTITNAKVEATLVEQKKGDKIRVAKFKAKSRYRKVIGFRAHLSVVKIDKIDLGDKKNVKETVKTVKSAPKISKK